MTEFLTAVGTALAGIVALATFVYTFALKPNIELQIGEEIVLHYSGTEGDEDQRHRLIVMAEFGFVNRGAQPAVLMDLTGTLGAKGLSRPVQPNLNWKQYEETVRRNPVGGTSAYDTSSAGVVRTTIVKGREAEVSRIRLYSRTTEFLAEGTYLLDLKVMDGSRRERSTGLRCELQLSGTDAARLRNNCVETKGIWRERIAFRRDRRSSRQPRITRGFGGSRWGQLRVITYVSDGPWRAI